VYPAKVRSSVEKPKTASGRTFMLYETCDIFESSRWSSGHENGILGRVLLSLTEDSHVLAQQQYNGLAEIAGAAIYVFRSGAARLSLLSLLLRSCGMARTIPSRYGTRREFACPIVAALVALAVRAFGTTLRGGLFRLAEEPICLER
jgi:hypothetical protein